MITSSLFNYYVFEECQIDTLKIRRMVCRLPLRQKSKIGRVILPAAGGRNPHVFGNTVNNDNARRFWEKLPNVSTGVFVEWCFFVRLSSTGTSTPINIGWKQRVWSMLDAGCI
jgi:hypothetical protein